MKRQEEQDVEITIVSAEVEIFPPPKSETNADLLEQLISPPNDEEIEYKGADQAEIENDEAYATRLVEDQMSLLENKNSIEIENEKATSKSKERTFFGKDHAGDFNASCENG